MTEEAENPLGYSGAECEIADRLVRENYGLLVEIARAKRRRARFSDTMCTTDILHESYLKLDGKAGWRSTEHFIRSAALAMRHVIVDHARRRLAAKRGGGQHPLPLDEADPFLPEFNETPEEILAIADVLQQLETHNPRWMRIVDARYFSGMTEEETARMLNLNARTIRRDWQAARAWIYSQLEVDP